MKMKKILCCLAFAVLIALPLWAARDLPDGARNMIYGQVRDESGKALEGAVVTDGRQTVFSAADGSFTLLDGGEWITVSRVGYKEQRFRHPRLRVWQRDVILQAAPIVLPTVKVTETSLDPFSQAADLLRIPVDEERSYLSTVDLLSSSTALRSSDTPLKGESQRISILGNLARHTLIMLDGVPLNPHGEAYDLSLLDPASIESVEVIKNNASAYGGGSAIGGIVRIRSKQGSQTGEDEGSLGVELGSFGYAKSSFGFLSSHGDWHLRLNLSEFTARNDFTYDLRNWWAADSTAKRENNAKRQSSVSAAASWQTSGTLLALQTSYEDFHRELPGTVNFLEIYRYAWLDGYSSQNRASLEAKAGPVSLQGIAWLNLNNSVYDNTRAPIPFFLNRYRQKMNSRGLRATASMERELKPFWRLSGSLAAETGRNSYQNLNLLLQSQDLKHRSRFSNLSLRAGSNLDAGTFSLSQAAALRYDHAGKEDRLSWRLEADLKRFGMVESTLGGTLGTSFSLPSPYDLYWKGDSQALGNPALKSELSKGWQLWLQNRYGPLSLKAAWHQNNIKNLIQWRQIQMNGNVWKPFNIGRASIRNLELESSLQVAKWLALSASALRTKALDLSTLPASRAPKLMYTPELSYALNLDLNWKNLGFWSKYSFTGKQWLTPDNLATPLNSYDLLDMGVTWSFDWQNFRLSPHFSVRNVMNKQYEVYAYVPQPGIAFYGGLSLKLGH